MRIAEIGIPQKKRKHYNPAQTQTSGGNAPTGKKKTPKTRPLWSWLRVIEGHAANKAN